MTRWEVACAALAFTSLALAPASASAHPVPFSYVDVRIRPMSPTGLDVRFVAHMIDIAHEIGVEPPDRLLDATFLASQASKISALINARLQFAIDGHVLTGGAWSVPEPLAERQSITLHTRYETAGRPGVIAVNANLFPYDPAHQTFVNFYENDVIASQVILDHEVTRSTYFGATPGGILAMARRVAVVGVDHILRGPDHVIFLIGLLLLGGTIGQLALTVSAFTVAHVVTLSLASFNLVTPPARLIEPAIALSIVYLGIDNLMVRGGRDVRIWIAVAFGLIHGFGFADALHAMSLSRIALGWSVLFVNVGVEVGQLLLAGTLAWVLTALRSRSEWAGRQLAVVGSVIVVAAGTFLFIERVFFSGGIWL